MLSLKWRAILLTSLLLLGLAALFTYISHSALTERFERHQQALHERQVKELTLALAQSGAELARLASLVSSSSDMGTALKAADARAVQTAFEPEWPTMQLDAGIDEVRVFQTTGEPLAHWGEPLLRHDDQRLLNWVEAAAGDEIPLVRLTCTDNCRQYAVVPALRHGEVVGVVAVSRSLADVARNARALSGSEIALLVPGHVAFAELNPGRYLDTWDGTLVAVTGVQQTLPVLHAASRHTTLEKLDEQRLRIEHEDTHFELGSLALGDGDADGGHFLLISDVSDDVAAVRADTRLTMLAGLGGWLAAEALLLGILWGPMARLRRIANALPGLAEGIYSSVRSATPGRNNRLTDEIDILDGAAQGLADQLETLEEQVQSRSRELHLRMAELTRERDFVGRLLDTAQAIILTQDHNGRITLVNQYAQSIIGASEEFLLGKRFGEVFLNNKNRDRTPSRTPTREESLLVGRGGVPHTIVWYHTRMADMGSGPALISVGLDITDRKAAEERLAWLANHDSLTNLYNRRFFQQALASALDGQSHGAMLFLDLDQFKDVNELSGHNAGDQLLCMVASALEKALSGSGVIARLGGDEFAVLLEGADADYAKSVAVRIDRLLEDLEFSVAGRRHRCIASIGIALYPEHGQTPGDLMASADLAMYQAKEKGTGRWQLLSSTRQTHEELRERVYWVENIRDALASERLELVAQPIMHIAESSVDHMEVLLRMRDYDGELITPGQFIPVAERSGQIIELDRWVLRTALRLLSDLHANGQPVELSVNLSAQSLRDERLEGFLLEQIQASGADPRWLTLEITETAAVTDFAAASSVMQGICALGCKFALDDFGVGFCSFRYLSQLPADYIKIDGSFIRNLKHSSENRLIVKAIADIAAGFGKKTIAEFVDDAELLPLLNDYGIDYAQGYHIGKPAPLSTIRCHPPGSLKLGSTRQT